MGPDPAQLYDISEKALDIMRGGPDVRQANSYSRCDPYPQ
jgi:hypothetical protein